MQQYNGFLILDFLSNMSMQLNNIRGKYNRLYQSSKFWKIELSVYRIGKQCVFLVIKISNG